jgi:hypothetical protein
VRTMSSILVPPGCEGADKSASDVEEGEEEEDSSESACIEVRSVCRWSLSCWVALCLKSDFSWNSANLLETTSSNAR